MIANISRPSGDKKYEISVSPELTIAEFKELLAERHNTTVDKQRLIFSGRILKDTDTLSTYKLSNGSTLHLIIRQAPTNTTSSSTPSTTSTSTPAAPTNIAAGVQPGNPLADLTGARYAGYASLPNASMFGPDGGMGVTPNPDAMLDMMNNPGFREQMDSMLSNPAVLDMMINSNPQLRSMGPQIRSMMQSPMFRSMMTNPDTLRQMRDLQNAMGGVSGAGAGGASSFPAPGEPTSGDSTSGGTTESNANNNQSTPNAANPFASLAGLLGTDGAGGFGSGGFGAGAAGGAAGGTADPNANPFAALLNPSLLGGAGGTPGLNNDFLASLLGGSIPGAPPAQPEDNRPPEERYESQLRQLNELGFFDFDRNVRALRRSGGNVQGAVEALIDGQV